MRLDRLILELFPLIRPLWYGHATSEQPALDAYFLQRLVETAPAFKSVLTMGLFPGLRKIESVATSATGETAHVAK